MLRTNGCSVVENHTSESGVNSYDDSTLSSLSTSRGSSLLSGFYSASRFVLGSIFPLCTMSMLGLASAESENTVINSTVIPNTTYSNNTYSNNTYGNDIYSNDTLYIINSNASYIAPYGNATVSGSRNSGHFALIFFLSFMTFAMIFACIKRDIVRRACGNLANNFSNSTRNVRSRLGVWFREHPRLTNFLRSAADRVSSSFSLIGRGVDLVIGATRTRTIINNGRDNARVFFTQGRERVEYVLVSGTERVRNMVNR